MTGKMTRADTHVHEMVVEERFLSSRPDEASQPTASAGAEMIRYRTDAAPTSGPRKPMTLADLAGVTDGGEAVAAHLER